MPCNIYSWTLVYIKLTLETHVYSILATEKFERKERRGRTSSTHKTQKTTYKTKESMYVLLHNIQCVSLETLYLIIIHITLLSCHK